MLSGEDLQIHIMVRRIVFSQHACCIGCESHPSSEPGPLAAPGGPRAHIVRSEASSAVAFSFEAFFAVVVQVVFECGFDITLP